MRAFILMMAAVSLAVTAGCETRNQNNNRELAVAEAPATAPRANLYPLTSPPPGTVQPLLGYAPTRIAATQYGPEIYRDGSGNVELAARNPSTFENTFGLAGTGTPEAGAQFQPAQFQPVAFDPNASAAAVTYPESMQFGVASANTAATFAAQPVAYNPNDPNDPYYCPPGAEFCPVPGSPPGAPTAATPAASFGVADAQLYAAAPAVYTPPAPVQTYQTYVPPPAPVAAPMTYAAPAVYAAPTAYTTAPAAYAPPLRLSAAAYTPPPARTPAPAPYSAAPMTQTSTSFGENEGTADIVGPVPSLDPIVYPPFGGYSPAPNYAAPYAQPYPQTYAQPQPLSTTAPVIPAAPAAPAPATAVRRPLLLSSAASAAQQPVSSVAGVSAQSGAGAINAGGYRLIPALDIPPGNHPNDFGPSQWFEVVRPGNGAVRIGRISATCACVGARIPKRSYEAGERILVEARMVSKPAANNLTYGLYVNIVEPVETVVDADVTLRY